MKNVIIAIVSAAISSAITYVITKKAYEKKMDKLAEKTSEELASKENQLSEVHRIFVKSQPMPESLKRQKVWDKVAEKTKSKTYIPKTDEEVVKEFREGILTARQASERVSNSFYEAREAVKEYGGDETFSSMMYEVPYDAYESDEEGYDKEEMSYYMSCGDLYDDHDYRIDEPKGYIGLNYAELEERVDDVINFRGDSMFFIRDDDTRTDYCITIFGPQTQSPGEASMETMDDE